MQSLIVGQEPKSVTAEAYRTLRTNLQFCTRENGIKKIVIASAEPGEGKTVTTCNLALSMSQAGKKVLVVDCDLRKPNVHKKFGLDNDTGFANIIMMDLDYKGVVKKIDEKLHIITAGKSPINPAELLNIDYLEPLFANLAEAYDVVLIDTPPVATVTDAQLLASVADGVVMVLSSQESHRKVCQKALQLLNNVDAKILGVVLNKVTEDSGAYYARNYYPYYGHRNHKKKRWLGRGKTETV
ncbi:MAG: CpsD/CapB family tyrosine-protein kinase [Bacillota bacterium]|nr:CpsD/CapB family tyrosine-protein kinase [Bacillota bacterium]